MSAPFGLDGAAFIAPTDPVEPFTIARSVLKGRPVLSGGAGMSWGEIFSAQFFDPFRAGLLLFLVLTARNTSGVTGMLMPLAAGVFFVAVLIPLSFSPDATNWWNLVLAGIVTNAIIVAALVGISTFFFPVKKDDSGQA
jgi:hypothetical protein